MDKSHSVFRTIVALLLLAATVFVCFSLGNWQLDRAAQRDAISLSMRLGRQLPAQALTARTQADELVAWRPAGARGYWRHELTVLLENRNHDGRPGFWVATPLVLEGSPDTALLVLRGWLPRPLQSSERMPDIEQADGPLTVRGELRERVPRLLEIWSWSEKTDSLPAKLPAPEQRLPRIQNLDIADYARATGLKFLPAVLAMQAAHDAEQSPTDAALIKDWPEPSLDSDKNRGYALQWFGFAGIAAIAWLIVAWRALRRARRNKSLGKDPL
ncbi:MAG: SURF1 family protein [Candidimonas sp.]